MKRIEKKVNPRKEAIKQKSRKELSHINPSLLENIRVQESLVHQHIQFSHDHLGRGKFGEGGGLEGAVQGGGDEVLVLGEVGFGERLGERGEENVALLELLAGRSVVNVHHWVDQHLVGDLHLGKFYDCLVVVFVVVELVFFKWEKISRIQGSQGLTLSNILRGDCDQVTPSRIAENDDLVEICVLFQERVLARVNPQQGGHRVINRGWEGELWQ